MKKPLSSLMSAPLRFIVCTTLLLPLGAAISQEPAKSDAQSPAAAPDPEAEKAWAEVAAQNARPVTPGGWSKDKPPKPAELEMWKNTESTRLMKVAEVAGDFLKRFPKSEKADLAKRKRGQALEAAARMGNADAATQMAAMEEEMLKSDTLTEDQRFQLRARQLQRMAQSGGDRDAVMAKLEEGARELIKDYPKRTEPYVMLVQLAEQLEGDKGRAILQEIAAMSDAPAETKKQAAGVLAKGEALGKPITLKFTAIDGREIDLAAMKGKVVLVDFWATWCGPCVAELPNLQAAYDKLHPQGFEILGVSFDQEQGALEKFVKEKGMKWPQFFDGKENKYGKEFGIRAIPTMWLVDKKGNLRDMNGREDLAGKVEKLLAE